MNEKEEVNIPGFKNKDENDPTEDSEMSEDDTCTIIYDSFESEGASRARNGNTPDNLSVKDVLQDIDIHDLLRPIQPVESGTMDFFDQGAIMNKNETVDVRDIGVNHEIIKLQRSKIQKNQRTIPHEPHEPPTGKRPRKPRKSAQCKNISGTLHKPLKRLKCPRKDSLDESAAGTPRTLIQRLRRLRKVPHESFVALVDKNRSTIEVTTLKVLLREKSFKRRGRPRKVTNGQEGSGLSGKHLIQDVSTLSTPSVKRPDVWTREQVPIPDISTPVEVEGVSTRVEIPIADNSTPEQVPVPIPIINPPLPIFEIPGKTLQTQDCPWSLVPILYEGELSLATTQKDENNSVPGCTSWFMTQVLEGKASVHFGTQNITDLENQRHLFVTPPAPSKTVVELQQAFENILQELTASQVTSSPNGSYDQPGEIMQRVVDGCTSSTEFITLDDDDDQERGNSTEENLIVDFKSSNAGAEKNYTKPEANSLRDNNFAYVPIDSNIFPCTASTFKNGNLWRPWSSPEGIGEDGNESVVQVSMKVQQTVKPGTFTPIPEIPLLTIDAEEIFPKSNLNLADLPQKTGMPNIIKESGQRQSDSTTSPPEGSEVLVSKLPKDCSEPEITSFFEKIGKVYSIRMKVDSGGTNEGFCFVKYHSTSEAAKAVEELHLSEIRPGCLIAVNKTVNNNRLFLQGIPKDKTREEIFNEISHITQGVVQVISSKQKDERFNNLGYAFVDYNSLKAALKALWKLTLDKIQMWGENITASVVTSISPSSKNPSTSESGDSFKPHSSTAKSSPSASVGSPKIRPSASGSSFKTKHKASFKTRPSASSKTRPSNTRGSYTKPVSTSCGTFELFEIPDKIIPCRVKPSIVPSETHASPKPNTLEPSKS